MAGTILIGGLFVLVFMGFPIAIALGLVCCLYSNLFGTIDMSLIVESLPQWNQQLYPSGYPVFHSLGELMIEEEYPRG
ncbi:MAG: hypothetical protein ACLTBV_12680 [Enterocloster bolteae]